MEESVEKLKARIAELEEQSMTKKEDKIKNVKVEVDHEGIMNIEIDLNKEFGSSKTGKSIIVATTGGFEPISDEAYDGYAINLNVVEKK